MNNTAISLLSFIPVRSEPSEKSEMVSQLLFGETAEILATEKNWCKIKITHDAYEGWCDVKMLTDLTNEDALLNIGTVVKTSCYAESKDGIQQLPIGALLPNFNPAKGTFKVSTMEFKIDSSVALSEREHLSLEQAVAILITMINTPYLWGGRTSWGIDCSGLSQLFARLVGINLPRDASQQINFGSEVMFLQEAKAGDLAFFGTENSISHVGIVMDNYKILHASGWVRMDALDQQGIYNNASKTYSHKLRIIKRIR